MDRREAVALIGLFCMAPLLRAAGPVASYIADPAASRLNFTGVQAGAEFTGHLPQIHGGRGFSPDALGGFAYSTFKSI